MKLCFKYPLSWNNVNFCLDIYKYDYGTALHTLDFFKLVKYFNDYNQKSTVGSKDNKLVSNVINETVRKSKVLSNISICLDNDSYRYYAYSADAFNTLIKTILPPNFKYANYREPYDSVYNTENHWDMLVYDKNDFFAKHTDGRISVRHYCTLVLIPPKKLNNYTGGELVLYDGNEKEIITADQNNWLLVGFPINVEHECLKILSGSRVIFKTKFEIPEKVHKLFCDVEFNLLDDSDKMLVNTKELESNFAQVGASLEKLYVTKKEINEQIAQLEKKKLELQKSLTKYQYDELINNVIQNKHKVILIVLERRYDSIDPNCLIGEDRRLFMELNNKVPNKIIKLVNKSVSQSMNDDKNSQDSEPDNYTRYNFPGIFNFGRPHDDAYEIIFQNNDSDDVPGHLLDCSMRYNDSTYDTVYNFLITGILVVKL